MDLYVYYEVRSAEAGGVRPLVRAMQAGLAAVVLRCRLLVRDAPDADVQTWMEIYEDVPSGFEETLAQAAQRHAISGRVGARHVERFTEQPR